MADEYVKNLVHNFLRSSIPPRSLLHIIGSEPKIRLFFNMRPSDLHSFLFILEDADTTAVA